MADEVIIIEMKKPSGSKTQGNPVSILTDPITTQVLDIGVLSSALNSDTDMIRIQSKGKGFWYKPGDSSVSAAADTNGNSWLPTDQSVDIEVDDNFTHIDTVVDS